MRKNNYIGVELLKNNIYINNQALNYFKSTNIFIIGQMANMNIVGANVKNVKVFLFHFCRLIFEWLT